MRQGFAGFCAILCLGAALPLRAAPAITGFSPSSGYPGTSVTITGTGLGTTLEVRFNTVLAIFTVASPSMVIATVPIEATSGPVTVVTSAGSVTTRTHFLVAPRVEDFAPTNAPPGAVVTIAGNNFQGATSVRFRDREASFSVTSQTQIHATVPAGATNGPITVTTAIGSDSSRRDFVVLSDAPFISSFAPLHGAPGNVVTIEGLNFTGATAVRFNGVSASFSVTAPTQIRATVPAGASTGPISITSARGTGASQTAFRVTTAPVINDFAPRAGLPGTTVTLEGANFTGATAVRFNGVNAKFAVTAATQLHVTVPAGATSGPISVVTPAGTGMSSRNFLVTSAPVVTDFFPTVGPVGTVVAINGVNFGNVQSVRFHGIPAQFSITAPTQLLTIVPAGAGTGQITLTSPAGSSASPALFYVRTGRPMIFGFSPMAGLPRETVVIEGFDLTGATAVRFNGTNAVFSVVADTQITTLVPLAATSGPISVTTPAGTTTTTNRFIVAPRLTSFSPTNGVAGINVTLRGTNLADTTFVRFGNVAATFSVVSPTQLTAMVPPEAGTSPISVTTPAGIVATTNSFAVLPAITSFTPSSANPGARINIFGTGFSEVNSVAFAGPATAAFTIISPMQIEAVVPQQAVTGPITVRNPHGASTSATVLVVGASADLALSQSVSADPVLQNQSLAFTLTVSNRGPSTASGVILSNSTSPNAIFQSATLTHGNYTRTGQTLRADFGNIAAGASARLTLNLMAASPGTITNSASVGSREQDPNPADNASVLTATVLPDSVAISAERIPPSSVRISWPATATNFVLQSTESLSPPQWATVTAVPVVIGDRRTVTAPAATGRRYYRLLRN
jgi:large repetitive protein